MQAMNYFGVMTGIALIVIILWDAFEVIILPRRVTRRFRLARLFYIWTWTLGSTLPRRMNWTSKRREKYLSVYGPVSLILLLSVWAIGLIFGFALLQWSLDSKLSTSDGARNFLTYFYLSGETFFTLGYGDVTSVEPLGRALSVAEAGVGFGSLAIVIGYLPVLYQAFSKREVGISLLDARAGSPPSAAELLRRHARADTDGNHHLAALDDFLRNWENWSAELLESHLSYPVLSYFRSQHDNQSWLSALTTVLDTCALVIVGLDGAQAWQAQLTFAMARHAVVDIAQIFNRRPLSCDYDRLPPEDFARLREVLRQAGIPLRDNDGAVAEEKLQKLRRMYEPYINALAIYLLMPVPAWILATEAIDNWKTSVWGRIQ
jgi:hypothetical protein